MAERTPLFMDISGVYSGDELGLPHRDLVSEGVVAAGDLAVTQRAAGANLSVDIAAGAAWILGDTNAMFQPNYRVTNDAVVNLGITPSGTNPRKVLIVAQIIDEGFAGTGRTWQLQAIHGTPAVSPVEPALPASAIPLALIDVTTSDTDITNAQITDRRQRAFPMGMSGGAADGQLPVWDAAAGRWKPGGGSIVYKLPATVDVTNTTTETPVVSQAIAAGALGTDKILKCTIVGDMLENIGTVNFTWRVKFGGTTLHDSATNIGGTPSRLPFVMEIWLANLGATNSQFFACRVGLGAAFTSTVGLGSINSADRLTAKVLGSNGLHAIDTTVAQTLQATFQWASASASLSFRKRHAIIEVVG